MTKQEFIEELKEIMEIDELAADQKLADLEEFDSLAIMSIIAMTFSKFKVKLAGTAIKNSQTVMDLMILIGMKKFN